MSSDIVYKMSFIADLFKPKAEDKLTAAKAKKAAIAEKCASEHTVVDKEISDAEAEAEAKTVNPIAVASPISEKEEDTQEDVEEDTQEDKEGDMEDKTEEDKTEDNKGGKSKKKKGGKSKKRKFSKKRKGGKRTKSQKKRR
jgi:hypothetical protein